MWAEKPGLVEPGARLLSGRVEGVLGAEQLGGVELIEVRVTAVA